MTRIQPECFIEVWKGEYGFICQEHCQTIWQLQSSISGDEHNDMYGTTIALFLIKPTNIPLAERLEARKVNNNLNP